MRATPGHKSSGFAQILVLVSLTGIGAVVTAAVIESMSGNRAAAALQWTIESDALAASAFNRISDAVANPSDKLELSLLEGERNLDVGVGVVSGSIESESSKVNLMLADFAILHRYATNAGLASAGPGPFYRFRFMSLKPHPANRSLVFYARRRHIRWMRNATLSAVPIE
jgi:hypothetical protein